MAAEYFRIGSVQSRHKAHRFFRSGVPVCQSPTSASVPINNRMGSQCQLMDTDAGCKLVLALTTQTRNRYFVLLIALLSAESGIVYSASVPQSMPSSILL